jgi:hypothetical protein
MGSWEDLPFDGYHKDSSLRLSMHMRPRHVPIIRSGRNFIVEVFGPAFRDWRSIISKYVVNFVA